MKDKVERVREAIQKLPKEVREYVMVVVREGITVPYNEDGKLKRDALEGLISDLKRLGF